MNVSWTRPGRFLEADTPPEGARQVIVGVPLDHTTSFRPGTRDGPRRIREVSDALESYSPLQGRSLEDASVGDLGDLELPWGGVERSLEAVEAAITGVLERSQRPVVLGGEHLLSLGVASALARGRPGLWVVQLDAHLDLRDTYLGQALSHACVMHRIGELVGFDRIVQIGVRSGVAEEWSTWRRTWIPPGVREGLASKDAAPRWAPGSLVQAARETVAHLRGAPFFLTIDVDVADPAFAPGTGTPEPGGPSAAEVLDAVMILAAAGPAAADVVEVCPSKDPSDVTSLLAAKLVREILVATPGEAGADRE